MLSESIKHLYEQISVLSADAIKLSREREFERVQQILTERFALLDLLSKSVDGVDQDSDEYKKFYQFLTNLKESDDKELLYLQVERTKMMAEGVEQKKRKKAVSLYHNVRLDSR